MEFFCYHRDRLGSAALRQELVEEHWSYMDRYAGQMIARGPTLADDGSPTGSVHILSLPDPTAARAFAFEEPNYQAGAYRDVMLRRWRTCWAAPCGSSPGAGPAATATWCSASVRSRAPVRCCRSGRTS